MSARARRCERTPSPRLSSGVTFAIARVLSANVGLSTRVNARPEQSAAISASCRDFVGWRAPGWTALDSPAIPRNEGVSGSNPLVGFSPVAGCGAFDDRLGAWRSVSASIRSPRSAGSSVLP